MPSLSNLIWPIILYFQMPSAFYSLIPLLPRPCKAVMAEVPVSPVFLDEQTEAQRRGWACDHPASHGGTLPLCGQAGSGGEPISMTKSPTLW